MAADLSHALPHRYTNKEASDKKILENAFQDGDKWFRSGDLLRRDEDGYVFFVDRIGDTFRWKGSAFLPEP